MGLLRTIFIIVLVYYIFKVLSRIFAPFLVKYAAKKAEQRFGDQFGQYQKQKQKEPSKKVGEITIDKMPKTKTSNKDVGDYVDYEEID
ncbi:DUF4834 family protein [Algibacter aquimarinus]|uniref:DUF4834 domain-containing protein n=1 Tax=Algibacter aquimarinus TaxID=1136748 RepID=A0ABP9HFE6_9FLAO